MKLFLDLSREEQWRRLLRRLDPPDHRWQFSPADVTERGFWDEYQKAYSGLVSHEHRMGAVVRDPGGLEVVREDRRGVRPRQHPHGDRAALPVIDGAQEDALLEIKQRLEAEAPDGAAPDPYEAELRGAS